MPRLPRLNLPGLFYHVIVRGIERRRIFSRRSDYEDFLGRLAKNLTKSGCLCFAWALMPNHVHLLILSGAKGLVSLMHPLLAGYATTFNLRYKRVGHLFHNRYKAIICEEDSYFLRLVQYIHLNAVRAGLVKNLEALNKYPWSGHAALMGNFNLPWQQTDDVLARFGSAMPDARKAYSQWIADGWNTGHQDELEGGGLIRSSGGTRGILRGSLNDPQEAFDARILGSGNFVERILQMAEEKEQEQFLFQKKWDIDGLREAAASIVQVAPGAILSSTRRRDVSRARALFIFGSMEWLGVKGQDLAHLLKVNPSSICEARERGRRMAGEMDFEGLLNTRIP
jgi:putative transposase